MKIVTAALAGLGLLLSAKQALAQRAPAQEADPGFVTLDRMDGASRVGIQLGVTSPDEQEDVWFLRTEFYGQVVLPGRPFGIYGMLPLSRAVIEDEDDEGASGNIEVGGFYLGRQGSLDLVVRGGLSLGTADDDLLGFFVNLGSTFDRIGDFAAIVPDTTWLRLSGSGLWRSGSAFGRLDLGFDLPVESEDDDILMRLSAGAGATSGSVAFTAELVNFGNVTEDDDLEDRFLHTLALSVRTTGQHQVHAAFVLPLDEDLRGELWVFSFGYQYVLR